MPVLTLLPPPRHMMHSDCLLDAMGTHAASSAGILQRRQQPSLHTQWQRQRHHLRMHHARPRLLLAPKV